jgi:ribosome-binding factor A
MTGETRRPERVAELVLRELARMLQRELKDPRLRGVTITEVRMSEDLRHCKVFFSHLNGGMHAAAAQDGFQRAAGFIRAHIGRALGLRYVPELQFKLDSRAESVERIGLLLRERPR